MRVIAGTAKGKALKSVPGDSTRPILDRVKTSLFDILRPELSGMQFLDLFAGTGAVGIEALSQGADHCIFLDLSKNAIKTITENLSNTGFLEKAEVREADALGFIRRSSKIFDLIFVAPPQYKGIWIEAVKLIAERPGILSKNGLVVVQIDPKEDEALDLTFLNLESERKYGNTLLKFYRARSPT